MSRTLAALFAVAAASACGSDAGSNPADTTQGDVTDAREVVAETTGETFAETVERVDVVDVEAAEVIEDELLVELDYGNQVSGSTLTIDPLGVTVRTERTCCPPVSTPVDAADLGFSQVAGLRADIEAVAAADETTSQVLGTFPDGATLGSLRVFRNGRAYVVLAYELQDGNRVRVKTTAGDARTRLLALVNGLVDVDLTE